MDHRRPGRFFSRRRVVSRALERVFSPKLLAHIHGPFWRRVLYNWSRALARLLPLGNITEGNRVKLFSDGDDAFGAMLDAIANAKKHVWLETYFFEQDAVGTLFRDALADAARRGCDVILLYDHFGSPRIGSAFLAPLLEAGGVAHAFNPIWPWRRHGPLHFRDHRKILIVDNLIGFCGGHNISVDYAGKKYGSGRFRDTVLQMAGPGVKDLADLFLASLRETTGENRTKEYFGPTYEDGVLAQTLGSNTRRNLHAIQKSMEVTLKRATRYCYFTTPYFLPYDRLRKAMIKAARRGVDVRVLTAGLSDIPMMRMASQRVYGQFLKANIRIYEMFDKTLHAKIATIDGVYGTVGSFNFDHWSARRNLEVNVSVFDSQVARDLEKQFFEDLKSSREVTMANWEKRSLFSRIVQWFCYQLMRL